MKTRTMLISLTVAGLLLTLGATSTMAATTEALWDMEMDEGVQSVAGEKVEQLDDVSGNGKHLVKAGVRRPEYSSDVSPLAPGSTVSTVYDSPTGSTSTFTLYDAVFREATSLDPDPDPDPPLSFGTNASFTVESWVKFASGNAATETRYIESWHGSSTYWQMRADKSGGLWYPMFRVNSPYIASSVGLAEDTWHHIAGVRDSADNEIHIYVDGVPTGTAAADYGNKGDRFTGAFEAVNDFLYLGREHDGIDSLDFHGYLDMVRISSGVVAPEDFLIGSPITYLDGDTDGDGDIDGTDLSNFSQGWYGPDGADPTYGSPNAEWLYGDFDGDNDVDGTDLAAFSVGWYGPNGPTVGAAVPEPSTLVLLLGVALSLALLRRR